MFQNPLIMYTLAHAHFVEYGNDIPTGIELDDDMKPVGALILSLQAVCILFPPSQFPNLSNLLTSFSRRLSMYSSPGRQINETVQQVYVTTSHPTIMETAQ